MKREPLCLFRDPLPQPIGIIFVFLSQKAPSLRASGRHRHWPRWIPESPGVGREAWVCQRDLS